MQSPLHATPPSKPTMIYDGDCPFCLRWIRRWQRLTGDGVEYVPFQDPRVARQFPEIPRDAFEASVQFIGPDGAVSRGAEAVLRALAVHPRKRRWLEWYHCSRVFAAIAEWSYRFVARHRKLFSVLTP